MTTSESASAASQPNGLIVASIVWAAAGAALPFLAWAYDAPFVPLEMLARWLWTAGGMAIVVASAFVARAPDRRRAAGLTAVLVVVVLACSPVLWPSARELGWRSHVRATLILNRSRYQAIVARVGDGGREAAGERRRHDGVVYIVVAGPPARVAFPIGDGILDNWTAIVHDPSGDLRELEGSATPDAPSRMLFGGQIVYVRELGGGYFYCVFT